MKKYFVVSDIHGHYSELILALEEAKFNYDDPSHFLIVCGDLFDRGVQSKEIYEYINSLGEKCITIRGNHEEFVKTAVDKSVDNYFNFIYNGFDKTMDSFLGEENSFSRWKKIQHQAFGIFEADEVCFWDFQKHFSSVVRNCYPDLLRWLTSLPYYYETDNYIFTHGMIDGQCNDWHHPKKDLYGKYLDWDACTWARPEDFFAPIVNTNKTIVVGHINTGLLRSKCGLDENDNSIFKRPCDNKVIGIDTATPTTKKINVLIIED